MSQRCSNRTHPLWHSLLFDHLVGSELHTSDRRICKIKNLSTSRTPMSSAVKFLFLATMAISGFLLFQLQPMIARFILPWFGGSATTWTACMLFFQAGLDSASAQQ